MSKPLLRNGFLKRRLPAVCHCFLKSLNCKTRRQLPSLRSERLAIHRGVNRPSRTVSVRSVSAVRLGIRGSA
jgi:hypothetical protein